MCMKFLYVIALLATIFISNSFLFGMQATNISQEKVQSLFTSVMQAKSEVDYRTLLNSAFESQEWVKTLRYMLDTHIQKDSLWLQKIEFVASKINFSNLPENANVELLSLSHALDRTRHLWVMSDQMNDFYNHEHMQSIRMRGKRLSGQAQALLSNRAADRVEIERLQAELKQSKEAHNQDLTAYQEKLKSMETHLKAAREALELFNSQPNHTAQEPVSQKSADSQLTTKKDDTSDSVITLCLLGTVAGLAYIGIRFGPRFDNSGIASPRAGVPFIIPPWEYLHS